MHHQPTTQATLFHLLPLALHRPCILRLPPSSSCRPSTPHNTILASRLVSWYPTLHFSSTLRTLLPWHRHRVRLPDATTTFLYSPPRRHVGSTKRDCCYVALGDQQVSSTSSSSSSSSRNLLFRLLWPSHLSLPSFIFGLTNISGNSDMILLMRYSYFFTIV